MSYSETFGWVLTLHVRFAFVTLFGFWLPLLVPQGGRIHIVSGRIFVGCSMVTLTTAFAVALWRFIDPIATAPAVDWPDAERAVEYARAVRIMSMSLGAMAVYTIIPLILAVQLVQNRRYAQLLAVFGARWLLRLQYGIGLALIVFASAQSVLAPESAVLVVPLGIGAAGVGSAWWDDQFLARPHADPSVRRSKHLEFVLRVGIAYHTVFALFVLTPALRRLGWDSWALIVPAVLPTAVGIPAIWLLARRHNMLSERAKPSQTQPPTL